MTTKARTRCWACAWMDRPGVEQRGACMEREPLYEGPMRCTRPRGHAGDHVACGSAHHRILSWGQAA